MFGEAVMSDFAEPQTETSSGHAGPTQTYVAALDAKFPGWDMWRAAMGQWCVRVPNGMDRQNAPILEGDTIEAALAKASRYKHLPTIPKCPTMYWREKFVAVKDGSKWKLMYDGKDFCHGSKTKAAAEAAANGFASRALNQINDWQKNYGRTSMGVEGVDFRYED
jgi:hypothetical protein